MSQNVKQLSDLPEVDRSIDETSDYYRRNVVPVDRGWAWVICFAGFLVYFVFGISNQTLVVLFVELINMYDTSVTMGSLVFMFSVFSVGFMSIVSTNFLAPRYGERAVVSIAGFFNMCGSLGLSFSPTIGYFIIMSILKGLATGAVFVPSISLIRLYFQNRRSIAQIVANVGQSAAVIIVPPAIRIIRKHYGIGGTFIILAGIELHMTVAGLLLRPISAYRFRPRMSKRDSKGKAMEEVLISEDYNEFKLDTKYADIVSKRTSRKTSSRPSTENKDVKPDEKRTVVMQKSSLDMPQPKPSESIGFLQLNNSTNAYVDKKSDDKTRNEKRLSEKNDPSKGLSKQHVSVVKNFDNKAEEHGTSEANLPKRSTYFKRIRAMSLFLDSVEEKTERRWFFRMVLLATIPGSANLYVRNYIPTITQGQGATLDESAILLTIVGAVDLISRLCIGLFADTHILTSVQIIIITQLCLASVCHCLRFCTTFYTLIAFAILIGCFVGTRISVLPLLAMEIVGVDNMPQALSFISTIGALSSAMMNPIFGSVAQKYGDFVLVMNLVGGCFTLSSVIMISMPPVILLRRFVIARKLKRLQAAVAATLDAESSDANDIMKVGSSVDVIRKTGKSSNNVMKESGERR